MLSLHNIGNASAALQYFSTDNYYTQEEGLQESAWFGLGASRLGLKGVIEKADFLDALDGNVGGKFLGKLQRDPTTGELKRDHRPGIDMTFSAPKSVSILAEIGGRMEVRLAHEQAVEVALAHAQRALSSTRSMTDGELRVEPTGNLIVALFRHNASRDLDPQTHTHAIVINATARKDGAWRSLTNEPFYEAQRLLGAIYNAELADRLQKLGYVLRRTDAHGNFEIAHFTPQQISHFSQRRASMTAAMKERGLDIDFATAQQKEAAALATRARKGMVDHLQLTADWARRAKVVGIDFAEIARTAPAERQKRELGRPKRLTGRAAMEFAVAHLIEREAVVGRTTLLQTAIEHGAGRVNPGAIQLAMTGMIRDGTLIALPGDQVTTGAMLASERWTIDRISDTRGQAGQVMDAQTVRRGLSLAENRQRISFTDGQRDAIVVALTSTDRFVAIQGLAGSGKTTMLRTLRELAQQGGYTVRGMAPTGVASKILAMEAGIASDTVSMFQIREHRLQEDLRLAKPFSPGFVRQKELWVVDESSFLSQRQKARLDRMALRAGAKMVYVGDARQLQGVEAGKPFELAQDNGIGTAYMTEISRQKTPVMKSAVDIMVGRDQGASPARLTRVALVNNARAFATLDRAGLVQEVPNGELTGKMVSDFMALTPDERGRTIVITAYNRDRREINEQVREKLRETGELSKTEYIFETLESKGWTRAMVKEAQYYEPGEVVRFGRRYKAIAADKGEYMRVIGSDAVHGVVRLSKVDGTVITWEPRKHHNVEVYDAEPRVVAAGDSIRMTRNQDQFKNGEIVKVVSISGTTAVVALGAESGRTLHEIDLSGNRHWDYAYATTVHGAQGATRHRAMLHIPAAGGKTARGLPDASVARVFGDRSFYVGVTRASHELMIYTENKAAAQEMVGLRQDKASAIEVLSPLSRTTPKTRLSTQIVR